MDTHLRAPQENHFSDVLGLWRIELSHMAWCGGVYLAQETFDDMAAERVNGLRSMKEYLPKLSVGLSWKPSFK